jgi:hypothetical protein
MSAGAPRADPDRCAWRVRESSEPGFLISREVFGVFQFLT